MNRRRVVVSTHRVPHNVPTGVPLTNPSAGDASRSARTPSIRHAVDANKTQSISLPGPPHSGQHALFPKGTFHGARDAVERGGEPRDDRVLVR